MNALVRVELPAHLCILAGVRGQVSVQVDGDVTLRNVLDVLERRYPVLCGTIRTHGGGARRPFLRFFAEQEDLSHQSPDALLPHSVVQGREPLLIVGAIAGG